MYECVNVVVSVILNVSLFSLPKVALYFFFMIYKCLFLAIRPLRTSVILIAFPFKIKLARSSFFFSLLVIRPKEWGGIFQCRTKSSSKSPVEAMKDSIRPSIHYKTHAANKLRYRRPFPSLNVLSGEG